MQIDPHRSRRLVLLDFLQCPQISAAPDRSGEMFEGFPPLQTTVGLDRICQ
jgi:hypothetical protein